MKTKTLMLLGFVLFFLINLLTFLEILNYDMTGILTSNTILRIFEHIHANKPDTYVTLRYVCVIAYVCHSRIEQSDILEGTPVGQI